MKQSEDNGMGTSVTGRKMTGCVRTRTAVIRFPQLDPAGIVFYPPYFELVLRHFPDVPFRRCPVGIKTEFLRSNRFGDRIELMFDDGGAIGTWSLTGAMNGCEYFSMTPIDVGAPALPSSPTYRSKGEEVSDWCIGGDRRMQLSRYFELLNMEIERWFETTLGIPFAELHVAQRIGIPTVQFDTRVVTMPECGERMAIWLKPDKVGNRALTFTSWLVCGGEALIENRQVVVFVRMHESRYESMEIPEDIRLAFEKQAG